MNVDFFCKVLWIRFSDKFKVKQFSFAKVKVENKAVHQELIALHTNYIFFLHCTVDIYKEPFAKCILIPLLYFRYDLFVIGAFYI